jgi:hypothetical protein
MNIKDILLDMQECERLVIQYEASLVACNHEDDRLGWRGELLARGCKFYSTQIRILKLKIKALKNQLVTGEYNFEI